MIRFSGPLTPSVEALLYRGESPLFHELKIIYADVVAGDLSALVRVAKVIQTHTHMNVNVQLFDSESLDLAIYFTPFDVNHLMRDEALQRHESATFDVSKYAKLLNGGQGAVDNKGAVTGVFTLIPAVIMISSALLKSGLITADELAAATLHEVGHLYSYFDIMGRTVATSFLIHDTVALLAKTNDLAKRTQLIDTAGKILEFNDLDADDLAPIGQERALEAVFIRNTVAKIQGDLGDAKLFGGEVEFVADSYAVHSGAASPLASFQAKLAKLGKNVQTTSRMEYIATEASKISLFLAGTICVPCIPITALISGLCIAHAGQHANDRNTPVERLEAVHADLVNLLKDTSLPTELKENLLQDVQFISGLREQMVERATLVTQLWLTLSSNRRHIYKQVKLQREIGRLVTNDLFVKAAHLSTLAPAS